MIDTITERLSGYIDRHNDRKHISKDVMKFALYSMMTSSSTVILCLCVGFLDGRFKETCIAMLAMASLRVLAGGYHLKSPLLCILLSTLAVAIVPFVPINNLFIYICTAVSALLVWKYAPADSRGNTRLSDKALNFMKYSALLIVLSNLLFESPILSVAWFIVSLTLIPIKGGETHEKQSSSFIG
ncbi:accessory gene regulator ArgB-like protein [Cohnella cholangitidis]|uniref:Accessory gene regulator B n=1 Tax=Cohnella cholangitidis TaxID=2598458 RepID=A0A7G5C1X6_9BACL|nr:accessory gene regulator B family protein [Cohnella cholangitidis]QMV43210.1 hypothetical protein FPL14_20020 [Cohnella cholangitidis]